MAAATIGSFVIPEKISDRYDPELIPLLEQFVEQQVTQPNNFYDLEANLALLNLYQFFGNENSAVVRKILSKALMNLQSGFSLYLFMIPERLVRTKIKKKKNQFFFFSFFF